MGKEKKTDHIWSVMIPVSWSSWSSSNLLFFSFLFANSSSTNSSSSSSSSSSLQLTITKAENCWISIYYVKNESIMLETLQNHFGTLYLSRACRGAFPTDGRHCSLWELNMRKKTNKHPNNFPSSTPFSLTFSSSLHHQNRWMLSFWGYWKA